MKSKIEVLILGIVCIFCLCVVVNYNFSKNISKNINNNTKPNNYKKNNNGISMMLEKTEGTGDYEVSTLSSWPTDDYTFNTTLSKCANGGELSWDDKNKIVLMSGNVSDKCYVYFDKKIIDAVIDNVVSTQEDSNVTVNVLVTQGSGTIVSYLYSINDGEYVESNNSSYTFTNLSSGSTYKISVKVKDSFGRYSNVYSVTVDVLSLINFNIENTSYKEVEGMTWKEWINSDYSNGEYTTKACNGKVDNIILIIRKSDGYAVVSIIEGKNARKQAEVLSNVIKNDYSYYAEDVSSIKCVIKR